MSKEVKEYEFKFSGYTLTVDHHQPEDFGTYNKGEWIYTLVLDTSDEDVLNGKALSVKHLCYETQKFLLTTQLRPDPFMVFVNIEYMRDTLELRLGVDLHERTMQELTQQAQHVQFAMTKK